MIIVIAVMRHRRRRAAREARTNERPLPSMPDHAAPDSGDTSRKAQPCATAAAQPVASEAPRDQGTAAQLEKSSTAKHKVNSDSPKQQSEIGSTYGQYSAATTRSGSFQSSASSQESHADSALSDLSSVASSASSYSRRSEGSEVSSKGSAPQQRRQGNTLKPTDNVRPKSSGSIKSRTSSLANRSNRASYSSAQSTL